MGNDLKEIERLAETGKPCAYIVMDMSSVCDLMRRAYASGLDVNISRGVVAGCVSVIPFDGHHNGREFREVVFEPRLREEMYKFQIWMSRAGRA